MRCPRCQRDLPALTAFCAGCGAPLLLGDEAAPRPLDAAVDLDRRGPGRLGPEPGLPPSPVHGGTHTGFPLPPRSGGRGTLVDPTASQGEGDALPDSQGEGDALPDAEVDALEVHVARASGWRRAGAWAVDALPFAVAGAFLGRSFVREATGLPAPPTGIDGLLDLLARERVIALSVAAVVVLALAVYGTLAHALVGATLGKRLFRLRVVGPDGGPPSPTRSAVRSALAVLSAALLGLGFVLALFTRSGRALHDLIARTWVVKAP